MDRHIQSGQVKLAVGNHEVALTALEDAEGRPFVVVSGGPGTKLEGDEPGCYYLVSERELKHRELEAECRSLAQDFVRAASELMRAFEEAQGERFCIVAGDDWPSWLPSFDEAVMGLAGMGGPDGFKLDDDLAPRECICTEADDPNDHRKDCPQWRQDTTVVRQGTGFPDPRP